MYELLCAVNEVLKLLKGCNRLRWYIVNGERECPINELCRNCNIRDYCFFFKSFEVNCKVEADTASLHNLLRYIWVIAKFLRRKGTSMD